MALEFDSHRGVPAPLPSSVATRPFKRFHNPPVAFIVTSDDSCSARKTSTSAGADAPLVKSGDLQTSLRWKLLEWFGPMASPGSSQLETTTHGATTALEDYEPHNCRPLQGQERCRHELTGEERA